MAELGQVFPRTTRIWIFNVGRGLAVFVHTALNQGILYDLGAEDFSPTTFIQDYLLNKLDKYGDKGNDYSIAQAILSHPHSDHIAEIDALVTKAGKKPRLDPNLLTCPHSHPKLPQEAINWGRMKNPKGSEGRIETYKSLYAGRTPPLQTIRYKSTRQVSELEYGLYYIRPPDVEKLLYPTQDQEYGNATSIMLYLRHGAHSILVPADMPPEGMKHVLNEGRGVEKRFTIFNESDAAKHPTWHSESTDQPGLGALLKRHGLTALVAPHHGLESGFSDALYSNMKGGKPGVVIISEKRHVSPTDGTVDSRYQSKDGATGLPVTVDGIPEQRYSVTTRGGHHILVVFPGSGAPRVYAEKDPAKLLHEF